jgi:hypothetical protein
VVLQLFDSRASLKLTSSVYDLLVAFSVELVAAHTASSGTPLAAHSHHSYLRTGDVLAMDAQFLRSQRSGSTLEVFCSYARVAFPVCGLLSALRVRLVLARVALTALLVL